MLMNINKFVAALIRTKIRLHFSLNQVLRYIETRINKSAIFFRLNKYPKRADISK